MQNISYPIPSDLSSFDLSKGIIDYSAIISVGQLNTDADADSKINIALNFPSGGGIQKKPIISGTDRKNPKQGGIGLEVNPGLTANYGPWSPSLLNCINLAMDAYILCKSNAFKLWENEEKDIANEYNRAITKCRDDFFLCTSSNSESCQQKLEVCTKNAEERKANRRKENDTRLQDEVGEYVIPNPTFPTPDGTRKLINPKDGQRRLPSGDPYVLPGLYYPYDGLTPTPTVPDPTDILGIRQIPRGKCRCCKIADDVEKNCIEGTLIVPKNKSHPYN